MGFPVSDARAFADRRAKLMAAFPAPILFEAGTPPSRNYAANTYPFRAGSHFLYFAGPARPGEVLLLSKGRSTLFTDPPDRDDALWHGPRAGLSERKASSGFDEVLPLGELAETLSRLGASPSVIGRDVALGESVISLRLTHDEAAKQQLRSAAQASAKAHVEGMRATRRATTEAEVCSAITASLYRLGMSDAYGPIVTVRGEVLHCHDHGGILAPGDLLLCDVGGESPEGWASDITRTWPVSGRFSATQRAIYDVVLEAQLACIAMVRTGVRYRAVHEKAKRGIVEGLVALGILRGEVDGLLERGAAALFFPHGIGHLLGLDVHDMEDLGDLAGYAKGRDRSARFGDRYLRLDRDLTPGMAVTIEPGFYQVPGILEDAELTAPLGSDLVRSELARYADIRGIRIEDDILCTEGDPEVLSRDCPKSAEEIERIVSG